MEEAIALHSMREGLYPPFRWVMDLSAHWRYTTGFGSDEGVKAKTAHSAQDHLDGAMGKRLLDREHAVRRHQRLVLQEASEGVDLVSGPMGEIGEGAFAHLGALAPSLP